MNASTLIRWSGLLTILGGALVAVSWILHPEGFEAVHVTSSPWEAAHGLRILAMGCLVFGLFGLYARQSERAGALALVGLVTAVAGSILLAGLMWFETVVAPVLAVEAPSLLDRTGPIYGAGPVRAVLGTLFAHLTGYVLFGIATFRAGVLARPGALLLIAGAIPVSLVAPFIPHVVNVLGALLMGAGLVWLGLDVWARPAEAATRTEPRVSHT